MSSNPIPSAVPPAMPPKIAGVSPSTPDTPQSSVQLPPTKEPEVPAYPQNLPNGDILLNEVGSNGHKVRLIERTDSAQFLRFFADCPCGVQGRFRKEQEMKDFVYFHLKRRGLVE